MRHLLITCVATAFFVYSYAQKVPYSLKVVNHKNDTIREVSGRTDSLSFKSIIEDNYHSWLAKGYVLASTEQHLSDSSLRACLYLGEEYRWGVFNVDQVPEALLSKAGFRKKQFNNTRINVNQLGKLLVKLLQNLDYSGYPFALIKLDSVKIKNGQISATISYNPGQQIAYGNLKVEGNEFVKSKYLESYLEIKKGDLFNSKKIEAISAKIEKLSYCKLVEAPKIKFEKKTCKISLKLKAVKANKIDALIGFAPNQKEGNKLLATGYINLDLDNLFKSGKRLMFNWRQFGVQSQSLDANYTHTNLFGSVINIRGGFNLFKQDTTFINRNFTIDIGYNHSDYAINFRSRFITSRLISNTDAQNLKDLTNVDFNAQYYGAEFYKSEFDHLINPRQGWSLKAGMQLGAKTILKNAVPIELFDSLQEQSLQGTMLLNSDLAIPISKLFVAYTNLKVATIGSNGQLFNNDLYRIGGVNSLRGFNELEIYASSFLMLQIEARILLSENSRLFGFVDWAYTDNMVSTYEETFLGIGSGLLLDTASGVFQLVYAVGKSSKQSLSLGESKIHFGYVAHF